jgi:hypothetical protein
LLAITPVPKLTRKTAVDRILSFFIDVILNDI